MDPTVALTFAFNALDEVLSLIAHIKSQGGLTDEQVAAHADQQDLQNKDDIKKLIAL